MADSVSPPTSAQDYLRQLQASRMPEGQHVFPSSPPSSESQAVDFSQYAGPEPRVPTAMPGDMIPPEATLYPRPQPEEVLYEWKAVSRPFKKRDRQYFMTVGIIVFLISLILFFAGQFLPIAVVVAVGFLSYVLSSVPPEIILNRITTYGIHNDESFYHWDELGRFWFDTKYGAELIHIETSRFPGRITLLTSSPDDIKEITELLSEVLLQEKPKDTSFDKAAKWLQEKIPLDNDPK